MPDDQGTKANGAATPAAVTRPTVSWDDSAMRTSYANVVNASSTREEVMLFFGTNQTWNLGEAKEIKVRLGDRIVLSPFAAKRLWILLGALLKEHETRFGALALDVAATDVQPARGGAAAS